MTSQGPFLPYSSVIVLILAKLVPNIPNNDITTCKNKQFPVIQQCHFTLMHAYICIIEYNIHDGVKSVLF